MSNDDRMARRRPTGFLVLDKTVVHEVVMKVLEANSSLCLDNDSELLTVAEMLVDNLEAAALNDVDFFKVDGGYDDSTASEDDQ